MTYRHNQISVSWHIADVAEVRPDLAKTQCRAVLQMAARSHDATIGINWTVLKTIADDMFPAGGDQ